MRRRSAHRRGLILAAAGGALALLAAACGGGGGGGGGAKSALVIGTTDSQVTSIDPAGSYDLPSSTLQYNVFQLLLKIPPGGSKPVPDVAQKCDFTDPKTYKCTIKSGLKFSNGDPLTSKDVKFSFDRNKKINDPNGAWSIYDASFKSVDAPDPTTVVFHLTAPDATWPVKLTYAAASIVDSKVYPADKKLTDDTKTVGSGHYKLTKFQNGQQAVLVANPNYSGSDKPKTSNVIVRYYQKSSALKLAIEQGDVDVAYRNLAPTEFKSLKTESSKGVKVVSGNGTEIRYLVFNVKKKPFDNKYVRQAVAQTINRDQINNNIYNGDFQSLYSPIPVGLDGHKDVFKDKYGAPDPAKAKALLAKAGVKAPLPVTLWYTPTHYGPATADEMNEVKRQLDSSGDFKVTLKNTEWVQYQKGYKQDQLYGMYQLGWFPDYPDSDDYLAPFYLKGGFYGNNYNNPTVNKLISKEEGEINQAKRLPIFDQIQKIGAEDVPMLPLWQAKQQAAVRDNVEGVTTTFDPAYSFRFWVISKKS
ncbi:MAG TPA: ABC transporter substrate-binding protein [Streptosporangiaceae bacterium]|jgi:peptide/nickel transport system substrate-binding protein